MGLLDTDIRNIVSSAVGFLMLDATLRKWTAGTFSQSTQKLSGRSASDSAVKAFIDEDTTQYQERGLITQEAEAVIGIVQVGATAEPNMGDHVVLRGTWRIVTVKEDPAQAMWFCGVVGAGDEA